MTRALIIDDEIDICYLLSSILNSKDIQASYVNNLAEAKALLQTEQPEIIFIDNYLPDGMGVDFITRLKADYPATKVVMITAFDNFSDRKKALYNGVDSFISKPFTREAVYKTVESFDK